MNMLGYDGAVEVGSGARTYILQNTLAKCVGAVGAEAIICKFLIAEVT